nr:hypothetical protein [uncultured Pedobacter sp.]
MKLYKNSFVLLFILFLLITNGFLIRRIFIDKKNDVEVKGTLLEKAYRERLLYQVEYCNSFKLPTFILAKDINNKILRFDSSLNYKGKLFFRVSERNCDLCVSKEFIHLKLLEEKIGSDRIIIMASYSGPNDLRILKNRYNINFKIINIPFGALDNKYTEDQDFPYFFTINDKNVANNIFVPDKSLPQLTKDYLNFFSKKEQM